jgi:hypothetical protein
MPPDNVLKLRSDVGAVYCRCGRTRCAPGSKATADPNRRDERQANCQASQTEVTSACGVAQTQSTSQLAPNSQARWTCHCSGCPPPPPLEGRHCSLEVGVPARTFAPAEIDHRPLARQLRATFRKAHPVQDLLQLVHDRYQTFAEALDSVLTHCELAVLRTQQACAQNAYSCSPASSSYAIIWNSSRRHIKP